MPSFSAMGVDIAFLDVGSCDVVVLSHGFASNKEVNWGETGWVRHLLRAGYRVIAVDHRGHGNSQKFYKEADYSLDIIATDLANTLRELGIKEAHFIGYSMGARTVLRVCSLFPDLVRRASLGGAGDAVLKDRSSCDIDALSVEIAGSQTLHLDGKDHMSAVGAQEWKQELVEFFG